MHIDKLMSTAYQFYRTHMFAIDHAALAITAVAHMKTRPHVHGYQYMRIETGSLSFLSHTQTQKRLTLVLDVNPSTM